MNGLATTSFLFTIIKETTFRSFRLEKIKLYFESHKWVPFAPQILQGPRPNSKPHFPNKMTNIGFNPITYEAG